MSDAAPRYADIQQALDQSHSLTDAAEAHGTLSGALCAAATYALDDWLGEILPEGRATPASAPRLTELFQATRLALGDAQMSFAPLLPDDDDALAERTLALGDWCRGFLYGLGTGHLGDLEGLGGDTGEILRDLSAITQVGVDPDESEENNEEAYAELVEFVRVGVQLVFERLEPLRTAPAREPGEMLH